MAMKQDERIIKIVCLERSRRLYYEPNRKKN